MSTRKIYIEIIPPNRKNALGINPSSYELGRVGDNGATELIFKRPDVYEGMNLRLKWELGFNKNLTIDIRNQNDFPISDQYTQKTAIILQIEILDKNNNIITNSNKITFYLTSSVLSTPSDRLEELMLWGISTKVFNMSVDKESIDPSKYGLPDNITEEYFLNAYNNLGQRVTHAMIPIIYEFNRSANIPILPENAPEGRYSLNAVKLESGEVVYEWVEV